MTPLKSKLDEANLLLKSGEAEGAKTIFKSCLDEARKSMWALCGYAQAQFACGESEAAFKTIANAIKEHANRSQPYFIESTFHRRNGDLMMERWQLENALVAEPNHMPTRLRLGELDLMNGKVDQVLTDIRDLADEYPDSLWPKLVIAKAHEIAGENAEAAACLSEIIERYPNAPVIETVLSAKLVSLAKCKDEESFLATAEALLKMSGPTPDTLAQLNTCSNLFRRNMFCDSIFEEAFNADPANFVLFRAVSDQMRRQGRQDYASALQAQHIAALPKKDKTLRQQLDEIQIDDNSPIKLRAAIARIWGAKARRNDSTEQWVERAKWGQRASHIIQDSFIRRFESEAEFLSVMEGCSEPPDLSPIYRLLDAGNGLVIACSHLGMIRPLASYIHYEFSGLTITSTTGLLNASRSDEQDMVFLMTPSTTQKTKLLRELFARLKAGGIVSSAPDISRDYPGPIFQIGDQEIEISTLLPRLAYKAGSPSLWSEVAWRNGKMVFSFKPLPSVKDGESRRDFVRRWCDAFFKNFQRQILEEPELFTMAVPWEAALVNADAEFTYKS